MPVTDRMSARMKYCGSCWMPCNIYGMIPPGFLIVNNEVNRTEVECPKLTAKILENEK